MKASGWMVAILTLAQALPLRAADEPLPHPSFAAEAHESSTDSGERGFQVQGDSEGGIQRFTITQAAPAESAAVSAILIALPSDGSGAFSLQVRLSPLGKPGEKTSWDVTEQVAKAVSAGKFPKLLPGKSQLMVQLVKAKGESVGVPLSALWDRSP